MSLLCTSRKCLLSSVGCFWLWCWFSFLGQPVKLLLCSLHSPLLSSFTPHSFCPTWSTKNNSLNSKTGKLSLGEGFLQLEGIMLVKMNLKSEVGNTNLFRAVLGTVTEDTEGPFWP